MVLSGRKRGEVLPLTDAGVVDEVIGWWEDRELSGRLGDIVLKETWSGRHREIRSRGAWTRPLQG